MPDPSLTDTSAPRDLDVQAFLYASGELDGTEAVRFERRLAEEQAAREALSEAVVLCQPPGSSTPTPNPGYRECVRRRLRPGARTQSDGQAVAASGRAVIWCLIGAAAVLLFLSLERSDENQKLQAQLHELAQELDRDIQVTEQLKQGLDQVEDELLKTRDQSNKKGVRRNEDTLDKAKAPKK
jgi:hypothetical protein